MLYSSSILALLNELHWEEAFLMKVNVVFTVPSMSSRITFMPLFILLSDPLRGPTASRNSAWMHDNCWSADFMLFAHSMAIILSRHEKAINIASRTLNCCQSYFLSALFIGTNALHNKSFVDSCTWVRWVLSPPYHSQWCCLVPR